MDVFHQFIREHGALSYFVTFAWTFLEGETFVIVAGFAAAEGLLAWPLLLVAAWLGSFAGDQSYFWIGRHFGARLLLRRPKWLTRVDRALGWLDRYDVYFILSYRFIYGTRNFSSFALGISRVNWRRFLVLNFCAAGLWAAIYIAVGYFAGHALGHMLGDIAERFSELLLIIFVLVVIAGHVAHRLRRRGRSKLSPAVIPPA